MDYFHHNSQARSQRKASLFDDDRFLDRSQSPPQTIDALALHAFAGRGEAVSIDERTRHNLEKVWSIFLPIVCP